MKYVSRDTSKYVYHTSLECPRLKDYDEQESLDPRYPWRECTSCKNLKTDVPTLD